MNSSRTDLENLIVFGRRGQLDAEQLEELEVRLRQRPFHADLYRWGRAFDLEDGVQPGDETLIARAVDGALRRRHAQTGSRRGPRWWRHAAWFLAAVVLGSSATALGVAGYFSWRAERAKAAVAPPPAFVPTSLQPTSTKKRRIHPPAATTAAAAASEVVEPIAASDPEPERPSWLVSPTLGTALSA